MQKLPPASDTVRLLCRQGEGRRYPVCFDWFVGGEFSAGWAGACAGVDPGLSGEGVWGTASAAGTEVVAVWAALVLAVWAVGVRGPGVVSATPRGTTREAARKTTMWRSSKEFKTFIDGSRTRALLNDLSVLSSCGYAASPDLRSMTSTSNSRGAMLEARFWKLRIAASAVG